jgi:putative ABC transport system permease protein
LHNESARRRWTRIFKPDARTEIEEELAFHLEARVRENIARGLDPEAARAAALQRLGDLQDIRSECTELLVAERRAEARRDLMKFSWLDFKLGFRMLAKYPGLTIVGGITIAFAIALGGVAFEYMVQVTRPALGLPAGDRIVALRLWQTAPVPEVEGQALHDFLVWRQDLKSIEHLAAFRDEERNLIGSDDAALPVKAAEVTPTMFDVARTPPLMGRPLQASDAAPGAPAVMVISASIWRTRMGADPNIIGRAVRLGNDVRTVVGVMPDGFAFPMYHQVWFPLALNPAGYAAREGPGVKVFGRLAPGATMESAQAELSALGARAAAQSPDSHQHLQPQILPFQKAMFDPGPLVASLAINTFMLAFLILLYGNVALLMFARAATRESEIIVRNALGASRGRILTQLFSEALVLGGCAAVIGLIVARFGVSWAIAFLEGENDLPYWYRATLSPLTVLYVTGLTLLAAVIAGFVPALKVTRGLGARLRAIGTGAGGLRFGGVWTAVIVAQVAFTVAFFPLLLKVSAGTVQAGAYDLGFPAQEYLYVRLISDQPTNTTSYEELRRRLSTEPGVKSVTFAEHFPGTYHERPALELEGMPVVTDEGLRPRAQYGRVGLEFFQNIGATVQAGRGFHSGDLQPDARVVVVNESFVRTHLGGRNALGRSIRFASRPGEPPAPWFEIIGVVKDVAMWADPKLPDRAGVYFPMQPANRPWVRLAVHTNGDPMAFAPRLRALANEVDPGLRLEKMGSLEEYAHGLLYAMSFWFRILLVLGSIALVLSLVGIYSVMSFTVARRTREIGVRVALGAGRKRIMTALFARALRQVGLGVGIGVLVLQIIATRFSADGLFSINNAALLIVYGVGMLGVCMLACVVPARRALRIQPTEALRAEA